MELSLFIKCKSVAILAPAILMRLDTMPGGQTQPTLARWLGGGGPRVLAEQPTPFKCDGCNKGFTARCYLSSHQNHCAPWLALTERRKRLRPAAAPVEAPPEVPMEGPAEVRMEALAEAPAEAPEEEEAPAEAPEEAYEDLQEPDVRNVPELAQVREILSRYAGLLCEQLWEPFVTRSLVWLIWR